MGLQHCLPLCCPVLDPSSGASVGSTGGVHRILAGDLLLQCRRALGERGGAAHVLDPHGVLRGCPLSGLVLFWVINPLLRNMEALVNARGLGVTRTCADHVGAALKSITALHQ